MKLSLKKKAVLLIVIIAIIVSMLSIGIFNSGLYQVIKKQYEQRSTDISNLIAEEIDSEKIETVKNAVMDIYDQTGNKVRSDKWGTPEFEEYVSNYNSIYEMKEYKELLSELQGMQDVLNVDCIYTVWVDAENECYIYLVDAAHEDACPVGCIDPLFTNDEDILKNPYNGLKTTISNSKEYGWLVSTGMPISDSKGNCVAFSCVDISMNEIISLQYRVMVYILLAFLGVIILVCIVGVVFLNKIIVKPINRLSKAASEYTHNSNVFGQLDIKRSDEIGVLADSMANMEKDINLYINNLEKTTKDLISAREHAEEMYIAANIDVLTEVRNKRAFDIDSEKLNNSTKLYALAMVDMNGLKAVNDTFGHEKGDISIKTICKLTCQTFKHSPVYRIGGDEFVVILKNADFENCKTLCEQLSEKFRQNVNDDSLQPWERVSAAVGVAVYDSEKDSGVETVLSRADAAMYENKRLWKTTQQTD